MPAEFPPPFDKILDPPLKSLQIVYFKKQETNAQELPFAWGNFEPLP